MRQHSIKKPGNLCYITAHKRGTRIVLILFNEGQPRGDPARNREDGSEVLFHSEPLQQRLDITEAAILYANAIHAGAAMAGWR